MTIFEAKLLLVCLFFAKVFTQDVALISRVATQAIQNSVGNFSDLNVINDNYILRQTFFDDIAKLEDEIGSYIPMGLSLQSYFTYDGEADDVAILSAQVVISFTDVDEVLPIGGTEKVISLDELDRLILPNGQKGVVCVLNVVISSDDSAFWSACTPDDTATVSFGQWDLSWLDDGSGSSSEENILRVLQSEFFSNFGRFDTRSQEEITAANLSSTKIHEVFEIFSQGLNVSTITSMKNGFYAYWDMTQQQILESVDIKNSDNPLLSNIIILNQEMAVVQSKLAIIPDVKWVSSNVVRERLLYQSQSSTALLNLLRDSCATNGAPFEINIYYPAPVYLGPRFCVPENGGNGNCNRTMVVNENGEMCEASSTQGASLLNFTFPLSFGTFNSSAIVQLALTPLETTPAYASIEVNGTNDVSMQVRTRVLTQPTLSFSLELQTPQIFVQMPSTSTVVVKIPTVYFEYTFSGRGLGSGIFRLYAPVATDLEVNGQQIHGVSFSVSFEQTTSTTFKLTEYVYGHPTSPWYNPLDISCASKMSLSIVIESWISPFIQRVGASSNVWWADCAQSSNFVMPESSYFIGVAAFGTGAGNSYELYREAAIFEDWMYYTTADNPVIKASATLTMIERQLTQLQNDVQDLEDRVTSLEQANEGQLNFFLHILDLGLSFLDLSLNLADKVNYFVGLTRVARQSMAKVTATSAESFAGEVITKLKNTEKITSQYDPVEAINEASIFSYQHGFTKSRWRNSEVKSKEIFDVSAQDIVSNPLDIRESMQINPSLFLKVQKELGEFAKFGPEFKGVSHAFGRVTALSSPIEQLPVINKFLHNRAASSAGAKSFLSNQYQRFPFHTSVSTRTFDIEPDGKIVYNTRFAGVAEPSIVGPTNANNPRVKIGYAKFQYDVDPSSGDMTLRPWSQTKILSERVYREEEVKTLYYAFTGKNSLLSTDEQWEALSFLVNRRIATRNAIDSVPLPNSIFLESLDDLMFFDSVNNHFKYNLFNNNCQTFVKAFSQLATRGYADMALSATDFAEFAEIFGKRTAASFTTGNNFLDVHLSGGTNVRLQLRNKFIHKIKVLRNEL